MPFDLDKPSSVDELYIERGRPVVPWRPIVTGDVFTDVQIPGLPEHEMAMVISHPCTMRRGAELTERVRAIPVDPHGGITLDQWATGHIRILPLPSLDEEAGGHHAANLMDVGMVPSADLDLDRRVACLSEKGVCMLIQRSFHADSRVKVGLHTIQEQAGPALDEAALLEEWLEALAGADCAGGADRAVALLTRSEEFEELLSAPAPGGHALREGLRRPAEAAGVRRTVLAELDRRAREAAGT